MWSNRYGGKRPLHQNRVQFIELDASIDRSQAQSIEISVDRAGPVFI